MSFDIEDAILEQFVLGSMAATQVDGMRRLVPFRRDAFDRFVYRATQFAIGEGTWDPFVGEAQRYLRILDGCLSEVPPLIPPDVAGVVSGILSRFRRKVPGEPLLEGHQEATGFHHVLGEELMFALGGDHGDGVSAAGTRTFSKMMSARIGDGFVHPVVGGHLWSDLPAAPPPGPAGGRHMTVLPQVGAFVARWRTTAADRPRCERLILDRAHARGWRMIDIPSDGDPSAGWYAYSPGEDQ